MKIFSSSAPGVMLILLSNINSALAAPAPAPTTSVTYNNVTYNLSTSYQSYTGNPGVLTSQPWWGDPVLAAGLSNLVQYGLGDYGGQYPASSQTVISAPFAYGLGDRGVAAAYWEADQVVSCVNGCAVEGNDYAYVILASMHTGITMAELATSLQSTGSGVNSLNLNTGTLINGAHSRPMSRRVASGEKAFWIAGDWGVAEHNSHDGQVGLVEIGMAYNYGPAQLNFSLGHAGSDQDLINAGKAEQRGNFVMVEGIIPMPQVRGVFATLGVYGQWGDLDTRRGYDTGIIEYSNGRTDTESWGVRARVDWENAFSYNSISFSPYADLWYGKTIVDDYTETGGSLPATFDRQNDSVTDLRIGLAALTHINDTDFDFVANVEAVHRFDSKAGATSGSVATVGVFSFDGQKYDQNWLKAGLGVEGKLGGGRLSVMLNATTEGEMPSAWVAASYQRPF